MTPFKLFNLVKTQKAGPEGNLPFSLIVFCN